MSQKYLINTDTGVIFKHDDYLGSLPYMQPHKPEVSEVSEVSAAKPKRTRRSSAEVAAEKAAK